MDRTERLYKIIQLLENRRLVTREQFLDTLEVSPATFKRDLEVLRDRFNAPISWDRELHGYRLDRTNDEAAGDFSLPGLWFSASELYALLTMQQLLENLQPGLLTPHIAPLQQRLERLLEEGDYSADQIRNRIRILQMAKRHLNLDCFESVSRALLAEKRLLLTHLNRSSGEESEREVSPQRLIYYRDNWYLDGWCHLRKAVRSFGVEAILSARVVDKRSKRVADTTLDQMLGAGYGIFSGTKTETALIRFSPQRARWVSQESWHPDQQGQFDDDGSYLLKVPYSDDRELIMDILRHGSDAEVLEPQQLRDRLYAQLQKSAALYQ